MSAIAAADFTSRCDRRHWSRLSSAESHDPLTSVLYVSDFSRLNVFPGAASGTVDVDDTDEYILADEEVGRTNGMAWTNNAQAT